MKSLLLLGLLLLAPGIGAQKPAREFAVSVAGDLVIDATGNVREYKLDAGMTPLVADLVERNVASWRFEPVLQDGKPVAARTRMTLALLARPRGEGDYELRVDDVFFGTMKSRGTIVAPQYPRDAIMDGVEARVIIVARVAPDGRVVEAHPYQTSLSQKRTASYRKKFENAALAAVGKWQYEPGEEIGGRAVGSTVMVPIMFTLHEGLLSPPASDRYRWRSFIPGPITPAPWVDEAAVAAAGGDNLGEGVASLDARFRLSSDVRGKTL